MDDVKLGSAEVGSALAAKVSPPVHGVPPSTAAAATAKRILLSKSTTFTNFIEGIDPKQDLSGYQFFIPQNQQDFNYNPTWSYIDTISRSEE